MTRETETGTYTIEFTGPLGGRYLGEGVLGLSSEITSHEEAKFEKDEEKSGGGREPEEPEGEAEIATPGYHDSVDYQLIPVNRGDTPDRLVAERAGQDSREAPARTEHDRTAEGGASERRTQRRRLELQGPRRRQVRKGNRSGPPRRRKARQGTEASRRGRPDRSGMHARQLPAAEPQPDRTGLVSGRCASHAAD